MAVHKNKKQGVVRKRERRALPKKGKGMREKGRVEGGGREGGKGGLTLAAAPE